MEEQLQANKISIAKWIFTGIDLFVVALVLMLMPKWFWGFYPIYFFMVYFRANLSVMMLRNERKTVWGALIIVIGGILLMLGTNLLFDRVSWCFYGVSQVLLRYTGNEQLAEILWLFIFFWFVFTPFVYSIGRISSKKNNNDAKWRDIFALTYFKRTLWRGQIVNLFLLSIVFVIAEVIGLKGQTILGSLWSVPLAMIGLWLLTRILKINLLENSYKLWIVCGYVLLLTAFWASQYLYLEKRIVIMISYVLGIILSYYTVAKCAKDAAIMRMVKVALIAVVTLFILPILTLGYNVFSAMDYVRIGGFKNHAMEEHYSEYVDNVWRSRVKDFKRQSFYVKRGVYYIQDKNGNIGLRDRRNVIIPVEFEDIEDCMTPYFKVKKDGLWGIYDISGEYMYRQYTWVNSDTKSGLHIPCQFTSITADFREGDYVIVTDTDGKKGVLNILGKKGTAYRTDNNGDVHVSKVDKTIVVPVDFDTIHYVKLKDSGYYYETDYFFIASKQVDGQELFWLYNVYGEELASNCISIIPISVDNIQATDIERNTCNLL